jgi:uncharacterized protein (DUF1330 family)
MNCSLGRSDDGHSLRLVAATFQPRFAKWSAVNFGKRSANRPAYVVFVCREIVDQAELNTYWQRVNGTLAGHKARVLMDDGRILILEGHGSVEGVTVYEFPSTDAAQSWYDSVAYRELRQHRKKGAKYLVVLTEGGVAPVERRMLHTIVAG